IRPVLQNQTRRPKRGCVPIGHPDAQGVVSVHGAPHHQIRLPAPAKGSQNIAVDWPVAATPRSLASSVAEARPSIPDGQPDPADLTWTVLKPAVSVGPTVRAV